MLHKLDRLRLYLGPLFKAGSSVSSPSSVNTDNEASGCSAVTNLMTHSRWLWITDGSKLAYLPLKKQTLNV